MAAIGMRLGGRGAVWTFGLCFCAAMIDGYDVQSMGVAAPAMAPALGLSRAALGPVFSASTFGLLIGALVTGPLADRIGRKWCLVGSLALLGAFSLVTPLAWSVTSLLAIRLLAGLGIGGAMPNIIALTAEASGQEADPRTATFVSAGYPFGSAVAGAVAAIAPWRGVFLAGALAPLTLAVLAGLILSESARFTAVGGTTGDGARPASPWRALFGGDRALATGLLWVALFSALLLLYGLLNWLPTLLVDRGMSRAQASLVALLFNLGTGVGGLAVSTMMVRGRRMWALAAVFAGQAAALIALAASGADPAWVATAAVALGACTIQPLVLYGLAPGHYPVAARATGVGAAMAAGRLGAIAGPLLIGASVAAGKTGPSVLLALLPLVAVTAAATFVLLTRPTVALTP